MNADELRFYVFLALWMLASMAELSFAPLLGFLAFIFFLVWMS